MTPRDTSCFHVAAVEVALSTTSASKSSEGDDRMISVGWNK